MRDSITSMEMASIALPICKVRRDLRNLGNQRRRQRRPPLQRQHRNKDQHQHQHEPDAGVPRAPRNASIERALRRGNDRPKLRRVTRSPHAYLARAGSRSLDRFIGAREQRRRQHLLDRQVGGVDPGSAHPDGTVLVTAPRPVRHIHFDLDGV